MFRRVPVVLLLFFVCNVQAQLRHPVTEKIVAIPAIGQFVLESGCFDHYEAKFGLVNHRNAKYGLQFITIGDNPKLPWLVILNGGPGRSNLRIPFNIDSLILFYNLLLPGYRGLDDGSYNLVFAQNDCFLRKFVANNRELYSTNAIADDILLIIKALQIDKYSILAHSFGTIIGSYLLKKDKILLDTVYAFSSVSEQKPFPNPTRLSLIIENASNELHIPQQQIIDTLTAWTESVNSSDFVMGMFSSFYSHRETVSFFRRVLNGNLIRSDVKNMGYNYLHREWLFDFALKFNIVNPYLKADNLYQKLSSLFIDSVCGFMSFDFTDCQDSVGIKSKRFKSFVSKYEFFFTNKTGGRGTEISNCAHADIWYIAPKIILSN